MPFRFAEYRLRLSQCIRQGEAFAVIELQLVVPHCQRPNLLRIPFLDAKDIIVEVCRRIEGVEVIVAIGGDDKYAVVVIKLSKIRTLLIIVHAQHIGVKPYFSTAKR